MNITKWKVISSDVAWTAKIFRYLKVESESPTTKEVGQFDVVQTMNWVNIIALTKDQKIVLIKQYRHGTEEVTTEIPGGAVHGAEDPLLAAKRELREETGYTSSSWKHLGRVDANPAFMTNHCDTYLAMDAVKTHSPEFDPFEEIETFLAPRHEITSMIKNREIKHSLVVAAFYFFEALAIEA